MPSRSAFPLSATVSEAARNLAQQQRRLLVQQAAQHGGGATPPAVPTLHKVTVPHDLPIDAGYEPDNSVLVLNPLEVDFYDGNPRFELGEDYQQLKTSIRRQGLNTKLSVTRRPGAARYMVEAGGNRRLRILKELIDEGEERFRSELFVFRAWRSESTVLLRHLSENIQRAHMTLYEEASGILRLKGLLEHERGETYSLRRLEEILSDIGFPVTKSALSIYAFVVERLALLGPAAKALTVKATRDVLQNGLNRLERLTSAFGIDTTAFYEGLINPVLEEASRRYAELGAFDHEDLYEACELAVADRLEAKQGDLRRWLAVLKANPRATREELMTPPSPPAEEVQGPSASAPSIEAMALRSTQPPSSPEMTERFEPAEAPDEPEAALRRFAATIGAGEFLRLDSSLPRGFYVEAPVPASSDPAMPLDLLHAQGGGNPYLYHGWWLLMQLSGLVAAGDGADLDDEVLGALPADCAWRKAADAGYEEVERLLANTTGPKPDFAFVLDWLATPAHPLTNTLTALLASLRERREAHDSR